MCWLHKINVSMRCFFDTPKTYIYKEGYLILCLAHIFQTTDNSNKNSSPKHFQLMRFYCSIDIVKLDFLNKKAKLHLKPFKPCHAEYFYLLHSSPIFMLLTCKHVFSIRVEKSVDADQMARILFS